MFVKWKLQIEMKLLRKNGIRIEIELFFRMEITLLVRSSSCKGKGKGGPYSEGA